MSAPQTVGKSLSNCASSWRSACLCSRSQHVLCILLQQAVHAATVQLLADPCRWQIGQLISLMIWRCHRCEVTPVHLSAAFSLLASSSSLQWKSSSCRRDRSDNLLPRIPSLCMTGPLCRWLARAPASQIDTKQKALNPILDNSCLCSAHLLSARLVGLAGASPSFLRRRALCRCSRALQLRFSPSNSTRLWKRPHC